MDQALPLTIFQRQQFDEPVLHLEHAAVAETAGGAMLQRSVAEPLQRERSDRQHRILHRHVDIVAARVGHRPPGGERGKRSHGAALIAGEMAVDLQRRPIRKQLVGEAVGQQEAFAAGMHQVDLFAVPTGLGAARAERQHADMDERGEALGDRFCVEAELARSTSGMSSINMSAWLNSPVQHLLSFGRRKVADQAALAGGEIGEQRALTPSVVEKGRGLAQRRAAFRLQHHDRRAHRREQSAGIGRRDRARTFDHATAP